MASPHVAGVAALAARGGARDDGRRRGAPARRARRSTSACRGRDAAYGAGLVRADAALGSRAGTLRACRAARHPESRSRGRSGCSGWTRRRAPRRSAAPGRSAWRARIPTATPSARAPPRASRPRSTRRASCASGGSRPASLAQADAARGAARARARARRAAAGAHAGAEPLVVPRRRSRRARVVPGREPAAEPVLTVRASGHRRGRPRRARGRLVRGARRARAGRLRLPRVRQVQRPGRRAAGAAPLSGVPRGARAAGALRARGRAGAARHPLACPRRPRDCRRARRLGLEELARERFRWAEGVGRRPREERRGKMLAAYAHAYALWAAGLDGARRTRASTRSELASTSRRSRRAARRRSRGSR